MKKAVVAVSVIVAACAAYVGAAEVSASKVETHLRALSVSTQTQLPMLRVTDEHYERGLFAATHTFTLRAGCEAPGAAASGPAPAITIVQHIKHGPLPGFAGVGAATVDTELALDAKSRDEVTKVFGTAQPFQAHTDVAFSGATHTRFTIAKVHQTGPKGEQIDFQGVAGELDSTDTSLEYDVRMPALVVAEAASAPTALHAELKGMHLHARSEGTGELALRAGKSSGEIASIDFAMASPDTGAVHKASITQVKMSQDTSIDKNLMAGVGRIEAAAQVDDLKIDKIELQATMKRLDAVAYRGFMQHYMKATQGGCVKPPEPAVLMASPEVQAAITRMLVANPEVSIDKIAVQVEGKNAEVGYAIGVQGYTDADAKLPLMPALMSRGYGNVHATLPEDWVQRAAAWVAQQSGQASGTGDQAAMVELMLGKMIDQGYVVRENGVLRSEAAFKGGQATINGKPVGRPMAPPADPAADPAAAPAPAV